MEFYTMEKFEIVGDMLEDAYNWIMFDLDWDESNGHLWD